MTKTLQKFDRPRVKLQGVWAHNLALCLYAVDVRQKADGSMVVEALSNALEHCARILKEKNKPFPQRIVLIAPGRCCCLSGVVSVLRSTIACVKIKTIP